MGGVVTSIISGSYGPLLITGSGGPPCNKSFFFQVVNDLYMSKYCPWMTSITPWMRNATVQKMPCFMTHHFTVRNLPKKTTQQNMPFWPPPQPPPNKRRSENLAFFFAFRDFLSAIHFFAVEVWCRWRWGKSCRLIRSQTHQLREVGSWSPIKGPRGFSTIRNKCFLAFLDFWLPSTSSTSISLASSFFRYERSMDSWLVCFFFVCSSDHTRWSSSP